MTDVALAEVVAFCGGEIINVNPDVKIKKVETDSRKDLTDCIFFALKGERFDAHDFLEQAIAANAAILCVEKGREIKKYPCWCVDDTLKTYQKLGAFLLQKAAIPTVGITGSVGKTSVKEMTRSVLEEKFGIGKVLFTEGNTNNHIGVPQNLMRLTAEHKAAVIEMGTSSFGEITVLSEIVHPDAALINTIAPCHLENLINLEGVAKEKSAIFDFAQKLAVFPADIPQTEQLKKAAEAKKLTIRNFGKTSAADFYYSDFSGSISGSSFVLHCGNESVIINWTLQGEHQAQNACGAAAIGKFFGMTLQEIAAGLQKTALPGMRAKITEKDGVHYYNDAYNANPASMYALLKLIAECIANGEFELKDVILLVGDMLELGENSLAEHRNILQSASYLLPGAVILTVGKNYAQSAADFNVEAFADAVSAGHRLQELLADGKWVFLKGSRSMRMENALIAE